MNNFSERLKEERIRLDLSQAELGELCGVKKLAQFNYEKGERFPDANYLMQAILIGVDVNYLLTGQRSSGNLSKNENRIIEKYRQADADIREEVLMILMDGVVPNKKTTRNDVNNRKNSVNGQQIGDNNQQHNHFASQQNSSINIENQHGGSIVGIKNK